MTNSELLELAASAAGIKASWHRNDPFKLSAMRLSNGSTWNPLDDDGDAARLAVSLRLSIDWSEEVVTAGSWEHDASCSVHPHEVGSENPASASRRAIVMAAAEIGRSMP